MIGRGRAAGGPEQGTALALWRTAFLLAGIVAPAPARAYVRTLSSTNQPVFWKSSCVPFSAHPPVLAALTPEQFGEAVTAAARAWSREDPTLATCTSLELPVSIAAATSTPPTAAFDHTNNVVMLTDRWSGDPAALALTSVFSQSTGLILDTDIEVNGVQFSWTDRVLMPAAPVDSPDLQNALTHEMGHAIGLSHTCYLVASDSPSTDDMGAAIPRCGLAPEAVRETTMFPSSDPHDISKRTLAPDDQKAVCDIYPLSANPPACAGNGDGPVADAATDGSHQSGGGGCGCVISATDRHGADLAGGLALGLLLFGVASRRLRGRAACHHPAVLMTGSSVRWRARSSSPFWPPTSI